jgi:hypothetical protein
MKRLTLAQWMIKHQVSSQHTNINLAVSRALNSIDLEEKHIKKTNAICQI